MTYSRVNSKGGKNKSADIFSCGQPVTREEQITAGKSCHMTSGKRRMRQHKDPSTSNPQGINSEIAIDARGNETSLWKYSQRRNQITYKTVQTVDLTQGHCQRRKQQAASLAFVLIRAA